jgi:hypothetical protein
MVSGLPKIVTALSEYSRSPVFVSINIIDLVGIIRGDLKGRVVETQFFGSGGEAHPLVKTDTGAPLCLIRRDLRRAPNPTTPWNSIPQAGGAEPRIIAADMAPRKNSFSKG